MITVTLAKRTEPDHSTEHKAAVKFNLNVRSWQLLHPNWCTHFFLFVLVGSLIIFIKVMLASSATSDLVSLRPLNTPETFSLPAAKREAAITVRLDCLASRPRDAPPFCHKMLGRISSPPPILTRAKPSIYRADGSQRYTVVQWCVVLFSFTNKCKMINKNKKNTAGYWSGDFCSKFKFIYFYLFLASSQQRRQNTDAERFGNLHIFLFDYQKLQSDFWFI